ncbi:MAG TPA: DUF58 domain-containing protein [Candidatus Cloacimonadota bacterium]|jgi:uncharacterized protein (DUF58 family)|nr:DUF58 domain-containing protein [Candidatus Cloacimonadales bacterium]HPY96739.1 DUF58 domain-containing protein [Candidatus Cloacimonadota bacterium]HQB41340.1 DUF58 domain-containing protein [Candidatus Cloacimonadota bacterium]
MTEIKFSDIFHNIEKFKLITKSIVQGFITGNHKSPLYGFSVEFSEHRPYISGDPVDSIDWKLFARTDKYYIKRYEDETNVRVYIVLDHSKSMQFSSDKSNSDKLNYSKLLTATLSYLALKQKDAVGLFTINNKITSYLPAKSKANWIDQILNNLNVTDTVGETSLSECLHEIAEKIQKRNMIIIISDFLDETKELNSALRHLKYNMNDVILININDQKELSLDYKSLIEMHDLETGEVLNINASEIRNDYIKFLQEHYKSIEDATYQLKYDYIDFQTNQDFTKVLSSFLHRRNNMQ